MRAIIVGLFVVLFGGAARVSADPCVVSGRAPSMAVQVAPSGVGALTIELVAADVSVEPTVRAETASVRVRSSLVFSGAASYVPYVVRAPIVVANGAIRITPQTIPFSVRAEPEGLRMDLLLAYDVVAHDVLVPCSALTLGTIPRPRAPQRAGSGAVQWIPREETFVVFARRGDTEGVTIEGNQLVTLGTARARNGWIAVRWMSFGGGASLRGFMPEAALVQGRAHVTVASIGDPGRETGHVAPVTVDPAVYIGPATIDAGTEVTAEQTGAPWATTVAGVRYVVRSREGAEHAEIIDAPGVSERDCAHGLCHAFVPRSAVHPLR